MKNPRQTFTVVIPGESGDLPIVSFRPAGDPKLYRLVAAVVADLRPLGGRFADPEMPALTIPGIGDADCNSNIPMKP